MYNRLSDEIFCLSLQHQFKRYSNMTGVTAKRNSVSCPKTAVSCGLTHSAAIQPEKRLGDKPSAATPETVIIGDRGLQSRAVYSAIQTASPFYILYNIYPQNLRQHDHPTSQHKYAQHHAERRDEYYHVYH